MSRHDSHGDALDRFAADSPCPVCGGWEGLSRGQGERCFGFRSGDWVHCTREDHAGRAKLHHTSKTYGHKARGACPCGAEHAPADTHSNGNGFGAGVPQIDRTYDYHDAAGDLVFQCVRFRPKSFRQRRPDPSAKGGWAWNLQGVDRVLYRLPELLAADPADVVFVVDGEKDVDRLRALEFTATTSPMGAGKWRAEYAKFLRDRHVVILPDHDQPGREHGERVARSVHPVARSVKVVALPDLPERGDVSDWLDAGGTADELRRLIDAAPPWTPAAPSSNGDGRPQAASPTAADDGFVPNEDAADPHRIARVYRDQYCQHEDGLTIRFWQGEFHEWRDGAYRPVAPEELRANLSATSKVEFDKANEADVAAWRNKKTTGGGVGGGFDTGRPDARPKCRKVSSALVNNEVLALGGYSLLDGRTHQPSWLGESDPFPAVETLPCRNALVHLPGLVAGKPDAIRPPTPSFFCPYALGYDFTPHAPEPVEWLTFLGARPLGAATRVKLQLWPGDRQSIDTLQKWFGYHLTPDTRQQKIAAMIGLRRSGKGTIARIQRALIGPENVAGPTLTGLCGNFGLATLIGKPCAIISDARLSGRADQAVVVERLLSISGEDALTRLSDFYRSRCD